MIGLVWPLIQMCLIFHFIGTRDYFVFTVRSHCLLSNSLWSHIFLSCSAGHAELSVKIPLIYEHVIFLCNRIFLHGYAF